MNTKQLFHDLALADRVQVDEIDQENSGEQVIVS